MKKLTFSILATFLILSGIPNQVKAATESNPAETTVKKAIQSTETNVGTDRLTEIKAIDASILNSTEKDGTLLKAGSPIPNDQGRHNGRYNNRRPGRDVDVTVRSDRSYRHSHSGAYIGGGGVLVLIIILILIL